MFKLFFSSRGIFLRGLLPPTNARNVGKHLMCECAPNKPERKGGEGRGDCGESRFEASEGEKEVYSVVDGGCVMLFLSSILKNKMGQGNKI